jgi:hypothetical protein
MKKYIVTTTINPPTDAVYKFLSRTDWHMIVVGDTKTPHDEFRKLELQFPNLTYMDCELQDKMYPDLSAVIGWKSIRRRNIGFVAAYNSGADIIATIDDDNIPYQCWGEKLYVGHDIQEVEIYDCVTSVFDPLSATNNNHLWHRGFPIQLIDKKNDIKLMGRNYTYIDVQADLWDGDPDIDAFERIAWKPCVKFTVETPYMGRAISPFNSQNTFLSRDCFPDYCVLPFVGRMDDIFGSYILQAKNPDINVIYNKASVYQSRNAQNLVTNLRDEYIGYEHCLDFVERMVKNSGDIKDNGGILPKESVEFYKIYQKAFKV